MQPQDVLERAVAAVKQARNETDDVEFSPEDAGRSEPNFLCRIIEAVIEAGATTINIPDTVGYTLPHQFGQLIEYLMANVNNADKTISYLNDNGENAWVIGSIVKNNGEPKVHIK